MGQQGSFSLVYRLSDIQVIILTLFYFVTLLVFSALPAAYVLESRRVIENKNEQKKSAHIKSKKISRKIPADS